MIPTFSLCHMTARVPKGWLDTCVDWRDKCWSPGHCEYALSIHRRQEELPNADKNLPFGDLYDLTLEALRSTWQHSILAINYHAPTMTNNGNAAFLCATGHVLVDVNDDLFPCAHWDFELLALLRKHNASLDDEFVIHASHGEYHPGLISHPIISRKYLDRIGPSDPRYLGYGTDDELTERAYKDGVVIEAPNIVFEHRHWSNGGRPRDLLDDHNGRPEVWEAKERIRMERRDHGYPKVTL